MRVKEIFLDNEMLIEYAKAHPAPQEWLDDVEDDPLANDEQLAKRLLLPAAGDETE